MQDADLLLMLNAIGAACSALLAVSVLQIPAPSARHHRRALYYFRWALLSWALAFSTGSLQLLLTADSPARVLIILAANIAYVSSYYCLGVAIHSRYHGVAAGFKSWQFSALLLITASLVLWLLPSFVWRNIAVATVEVGLLLWALQPLRRHIRLTQQGHRGDRYLQLCWWLLLLNVVVTNIAMVPVSPIGIATSLRLLMFVLLNSILLATAVYSVYHNDLLEDSRQESLTDALTGVYNRKVFQRLPTLQASDCILMADIDHFKQVNDRYGHDVGDYVIAQFALILRHSVRPQDVVIRLGGEEFLVIFTQCTLADVRVVAEQLRRNTAQLPLQCHGQSLTISASFGLCQLGDNSLSDAMRRADTYLYQAKQAGRNCVKCDDAGIAPHNSQFAS